MEGSSSTLTYNGSISEAIVQAREQKKLFLVYISDDGESLSSEESIWVDTKVVDAVSRKCIFLHLINGTTDASNFCAIFPQKSIPSFSAIGCNGTVLWSHEGNIDAEGFVSCMEKAWAALHLQDTPATLLTAALASRQTETSAPGPEDSALHEGNSLSSNGPSISVGNKSQGSESETPYRESAGDCKHDSVLGVNETNHEALNSDFPVVSSSNTARPSTTTSTTTSNQSHRLEEAPSNSSLVETQDCEPCNRVEVKEKEIDSDEKRSQSSFSDVKSNILQTNSINEKGKGLMIHATQMTSQVYKETVLETDKATPKITQSVQRDCTSGPSNENLEIAGYKVEERIQDENIDDSPSPSVVKLKEVLLNIRLPSGSSFQSKFSSSATLRLVKNHVNENAESNLGSYNLAVPYPRKVFTEEDMDRELFELGFAKREALIIVPSRDTTRAKPRERSSLDSSNIREVDTNDSREGYFGYLKRILSYFNPFSYIGGADNPSTYHPVQNDNLSQHRPSPNIQDNLSGGEAPYHPYLANRQASGGDNSSVRRRRLNSSGNNVRTLRDLEGDDDKDIDRNMFWNGNSTQFGGDDKK